MAIQRDTGQYEQIGQCIGSMVDVKQRAYGRSFDKAGDILRLIYPYGIETKHYDDLLAMVRIINKLFRIATDRGALGEDPWQDVAGYALLMNRNMDTNK